VSATRKLAAILVADIVGYSRLAGADEDRILARLRALRSDLIDPTIAVHHGRVVKRTGDGAIVEFRSVVDAVNCAIEFQRAMAERILASPTFAVPASNSGSMELRQSYADRRPAGGGGSTRAFAEFDAAYREFFADPLPRTTVAAGLDGIGIEMDAIAYVES
jgi:hypothetical protein